MREDLSRCACSRLFQPGQTRYDVSTMKCILHTERLDLSLLSPADARRVLDFITRNREFLTPTEPDRSLPYYTLEGVRSMLSHERRDADAGRLYRFWITRSCSSTIIGSVLLSCITYGASHSSCIAYRLDQDCQGMGYMTEALREVIRFAFEDLHLHRIEANIMPRNTRSISIAKRLGFLIEGLSREYLCINGVWEDHLRTALINKHWEAAP